MFSRAGRAGQPDRKRLRLFSGQSAATVTATKEDPTWDPLSSTVSAPPSLGAKPLSKHDEASVPYVVIHLNDDDRRKLHHEKSAQHHNYSRTEDF